MDNGLFMILYTFNMIYIKGYRKSSMSKYIFKNFNFPFFFFFLFISNSVQNRGKKKNFFFKYAMIGHKHTSSFWNVLEHLLHKSKIMINILSIF